jgi:two-component system NtrC family sensor kinase
MEPAVKVDTAMVGRLLLVDDEENILRSIKRVLRRGNWLIETALDGEKAMELFERFAPDVVISDFRMPGMNGVEFLARVKELSPRTQRIMLTGQADHQAIEEAINRSEVFRFVSKPWNDAQLMLTVRSAFEQHALLTENDRLYQLTQTQNTELRTLNADLEQRVMVRTRMLSVAKRDWEMTFDTIDQPLAVIETSNFGVRRANLAYGRAAGRPIQDLGERAACYRFLFDRSAPCDACPLKAGVAAGGHASAEIVHGEKVYVLTVYPMEEKVAVCSYQDVTEERTMTRQLIETEKMAAVGNLAGGVAHEINNPLGGILAFAQLMQRDAGRSPTDLESLGLIEESAMRCKRIVDSLLKFSRKSRVEERRGFDLSRCVDDAVVLFRAQIKGYPKVTLQTNLASGLPEVFGEPAQLGQVCLNLLQNALQSLPAGTGALTIETGERDSRCYFQISDTGAGIRPEHLPRIFEPHFTTKPPGEGTGLGLAIAYRIVEDHGGEFEVHTEVGKGSTFTVLIPAKPGGAS